MQSMNSAVDPKGTPEFKDRLPEAEPTAPIPAPRRDERSEACQTEPGAMPSVAELSPSLIDTDVRRRGIDPVVTGVSVGIIAAILVFLLGFAYLVVSYLRYTDG